MRVDGFTDKVKEWWLSFNVIGTRSFVLASKLGMLKPMLLGLFKNIDGCVSDSPKLVYF